MSFFFNKSGTDQNLQYDDTAFLHFAIAITTVISLIFFCMVKNDLSKFKRQGINKLKKLNIYKEKIKNHNRVRNSYYSSWPFIIKIIIIFLCLSVAYDCYSNIGESTQMIGFDPYEILGVQFEAPIPKIKKAYRKLALQYHPDRNVNNPEAGAKFIQISKAYECLTDPQAKQKCQKFGNPDGQASFKVGIGLPKFMVSSQNQYLVLPAIFLIMLVVIPRIFLAWSSKIKTKDESGMDIASYWNVFPSFHLKMKPLGCTWAMASMKELQYIFPQQYLSQEDEAILKKLLIQSESLRAEDLENAPKVILHRTLCFYQYFSGQSKQPLIAEAFPDLALKLAHFSSYFGQRRLEGKALYMNSQWIIKFCGLLPLKVVVDFTRQLFNPNIKIGDVCSIQFLDLTPSQISIAKSHPKQNLHKQLLNSYQQIENFLKFFPEENRNYIKEQMQCLPVLSLNTRCLVGNEEVTEFTTEDFANIEIKINKHNKTHGYVTVKDHPFLHDQYFFIIVSASSNLLFLLPFKFENEQQQFVVKVPFRSTEVGERKINVRVASYCYPANMDLMVQNKFDIIEPPEDRPINFHQEDLEIEKKSKDFWESMVSMDLENDSDKEMSDGDSSSEEQEKPRWEESSKNQ